MSGDEVPGPPIQKSATGKIEADPVLVIQWAVLCLRELAPYWVEGQQRQINGAPDLRLPGDTFTVKDVAETLGKYLVYLRLISDWVGLDKAVVTMTIWDVAQRPEGDARDVVQEFEAIT